MNSKNRIALLSLAAVCGLPIVGHAAEFNSVQADKSSLVFGFKQMNVGMEGRFKKFAAQMSFDPAKVASAKVSLDVDLASIDTGSAEGDDEVAGKLLQKSLEERGLNFLMGAQTQALLNPADLGAWVAERSAQVKEEPAQRAGDTERNALPSRLRGCQRDSDCSC